MMNDVVLINELRVTAHQVALSTVTKCSSINYLSVHVLRVHACFFTRLFIILIVCPSCRVVAYVHGKLLNCTHSNNIRALDANILRQ